MKIKKLYYFLLLLLLHLTYSSGAQEIKKWKIEDLEHHIQQSDRPIIVNFWATFCIPCLAEIPYFQELTKKYENENVQLLLVSLDLKEMYPKKLSDFIKKRKFTAPVAFLDESNADIFCPKVDKSWSGAVPASLFVNNKTGYRKFYEEELSKKKLEKEIALLIQKDENKKTGR